MFWGANLKSGQSYDFKGLQGKLLTFSTACLNNTSDEGKYFVSITNKNQTYNLTSLQKEKHESSSIQNTLLIENGMKLSISGGAKGDVAVTGYIETEFNETTGNKLIPQENQTQNHQKNKKT